MFHRSTLQCHTQVAALLWHKCHNHIEPSFPFSFQSHNSPRGYIIPSTIVLRYHLSFRSPPTRDSQMYLDQALAKIQFRRRSETSKFASLRWTYIVVSSTSSPPHPVKALTFKRKCSPLHHRINNRSSLHKALVVLYFGVSVIQDLAKRDYIYVQHLKYITGQPWRVPDLLVCTSNATLVYYDRMAFNYTSYAIKGPTVPADKYVRSPCLLPEHDTVYNFRTNFKDGQELPRKNLDEILRNVTFTTTSTVRVVCEIVVHDVTIHQACVSF